MQRDNQISLARFHHLDPLTKSDRIARDDEELKRFSKMNYGGEELWIEQTHRGAPCFIYRVGNFSHSNRYRFIGYVPKT